MDGASELLCGFERKVKEKYDITLTTFGAIGFSGMMHGYLPFDKEGKQLAYFVHGEIRLLGGFRKII